MDLSELFPPLIRPTEGWQITSAPYDYQERDHDETFRLWDEGVEGAMTRIFTGGGKTYSTCNKARTWLNRGDDYYVMIISYEKQLVWQFAQEIEDFLGIPPGIEMECEVVDPRRIPRIVVASRASLLIHEKPTLEMLEELETRGITQVRACTKKRCTAYLRALKKGASVQEIVEDIERAQRTTRGQERGVQPGAQVRPDAELDALLRRGPQTQLPDGIGGPHR